MNEIAREVQACIKAYLNDDLTLIKLRRIFQHESFDSLPVEKPSFVFTEDYVLRKSVYLMDYCLMKNYERAVHIYYEVTKLLVQREWRWTLDGLWYELGSHLSVECSDEALNDLVIALRTIDEERHQQHQLGRQRLAAVKEALGYMMLEQTFSQRGATEQHEAEDEHFI